MEAYLGERDDLHDFALFYFPTKFFSSIFLVNNEQYFQSTRQLRLFLFIALSWTSRRICRTLWLCLEFVCCTLCSLSGWTIRQIFKDQAISPFATESVVNDVSNRTCWTQQRLWVPVSSSCFKLTIRETGRRFFFLKQELYRLFDDKTVGQQKMPVTGIRETSCC